MFSSYFIFYFTFASCVLCPCCDVHIVLLSAGSLEWGNVFVLLVVRVSHCPETASQDAHVHKNTSWTQVVLNQVSYMALPDLFWRRRPAQGELRR